MRFVSATASRTTPRRLSITTKSLPAPAIFENCNGFCIGNFRRHSRFEPAAQSNQPLPKLTETIDVRVINVDVVVTDKKGNAVTGLKPEDFELYENGVPKKISNFYEVEGNKALSAVNAQ